MISDFELEQVQQDFFLECMDLCNNIEDQLLDYEKNRSEASMTEIFRDLHSIKGCAYCVNFKNLGDFVHQVENIVTGIRDGKIEEDDSIFSNLLDFNDRIKESVKELSEHEVDDHNLDFSNDLNKITNINGSKPKEAQVKKVDTVAPQTKKEESGKVEAKKENKPVEKKAQKQKDSSEKKSSKEVTIHPPKILIVDDEEALRETIIDILDISGKYETFGASDGLEALDISKTKKVDLIISDVKMPNMAGDEFVRSVREFDSYTPIIMISGESTSENLRNLINAGVDAFFEKPFDPSFLTAKIEQLLKLRKVKTAAQMLSSLVLRVGLNIVKHMPIDKEFAEERKKMESQLNDIARLAQAINED